MKSIKLLQEAANVLVDNGSVSQETRQATANDINLFLDDQERRAANGLVNPGMRVSTDGENWEYTDTVHVVSTVKEPGQEGMKEFSMVMTSGNLSMDVRSTISTESAGTIKVDYEALTTFGLEGVTITESGNLDDQK